MGPRTRQQPLEHRLLLTATFCLMAGGAVMVYSASSARTLLEGHGEGTAYLVKYLMYGAVGLGVMHLLARHDLARVRRYTPLLLVAAFAMLVLVLVPGGLPLRQLGLVVAAGAFLVLLFALFEPYRRARLTAFLNPWADAGGSGFQAVQGQIAIGSGGLFGVGPGQSVQKIFYLPEAHTDFILAVIGEELGVAGVCGLLFLYGMIGYAGLRTAKNAKGAYAKLLAGGLTSLILCQALLNVYAVLGLAPLTGVPLPFVSSGSTSLIVLLCAMGLLLNVASGGSAQLRAVPTRPRGARERAAADRDRRRRDGGARGAGD